MKVRPPSVICTEFLDVCISNLSYHYEAKVHSSDVYIYRIKKQMLRCSQEKLLALCTGMLAFSFQVIFNAV